MSKKFHLQPLLDLSNLRLDEATRQLGKLIAGEQEASQRLTLLVEYRAEYQARFLAAAGNGLGPDAWRNYTIIGTEGRIENFGDDPPLAELRVWNRRTGYNGDADERYPISAEAGSHGGGDPKIVREFIRYVLRGGPTTTSPVASRNSVAAGYLATRSLREGGIPFDVPPVDPVLAAYFELGRPAKAAASV